MRKIFFILMLAFTSQQGFASSFTIKEFTGHFHNYSSTISPRIEITISWVFKNGWGAPVESGQNSAITDSQGQFYFKKIKRRNLRAEMVDILIGIKDLSTNKTLLKPVFYSSIINGADVSEILRDVSAYDFDVINIDNIRMRSGKSVENWLKENDFSGLTGHFQISYKYKEPRRYSADIKTHFTKEFYNKYENQRLVLNNDELPLLLFDVDAGERPLANISFWLTVLYSHETIYFRNKISHEYNGVAPAELYQNIFIED